MWGRGSAISYLYHVNRAMRRAEEDPTHWWWSCYKFVSNDTFLWKKERLTRKKTTPSLYKIFSNFWLSVLGRSSALWMKRMKEQTSNTTFRRHSVRSDNVGGVDSEAYNRRPCYDPNRWNGSYTTYANATNLDEKRSLWYKLDISWLYLKVIDWTTHFPLEFP